MRKYIIKNCPACYDYEGKYGCEDNHDEQGRDTYCECITDCVMKQIVDLCNSTKDECKTCECFDSHLVCFGERVFADKVLQLLDVQEVE